METYLNMMLFSTHVAEVLDCPIPDVPFSEIIERARSKRMKEAQSLSENKNEKDKEE